MVRGESKSPKRKVDVSTASSSSTRNSRPKLTDAFPEVGRRIKVYKNGELYDQGIAFVLNVRKTHDIGTFLDTISSRIGLVQGAKKLYTLDGKLVKKTDELENGKEYVASSSTFTRMPYGKKKMEREGSSISTRSISRSRVSSTGPASRSKSNETLTKRVKASEKVNGTVGGSSSGGGTFQRSKSQVSLKAKTNPVPNGGAKIVTPVTKRAKKSMQDTTIATTKKVVRDKAGNAIGATKTTATKVEKKVQKEGEKAKKIGAKGKKKVKETVKESGAVVENAGGAVTGAIAAAEVVRERSPSPPPPKSKTPTPREKTPSPKESPRPKTAASRPTTAASLKQSERESVHASDREDSKSEERDDSGEEESRTASESEEEEESGSEGEREDSEASGRANTAASSRHSSRRASLKSNKSVKSHHG